MAAAALTSWIAAATALRHSHPQRFLLPPPPPFPFHSPSLSSRRHYIRPFTMSLKPDSSQTSPAIGASMAPSQTPPSSSSVQRIKLDDISWDHSFVRELPGDSREGGPVRQVSLDPNLLFCLLSIFPFYSIVVRSIPSTYSVFSSSITLDYTVMPQEDLQILL